MTISSVPAQQFAAKPDSLICEPSQAVAGTAQRTLVTHGGCLHWIVQGWSLATGCVEPQSLVATAEAL